jgi:hypothetical protein
MSTYRLDRLFAPASLALEIVSENLHLYVVSTVYWLLIVGFLALRYGFAQRTMSDRLRLPIVGPPTPIVTTASAAARPGDAADGFGVPRAVGVLQEDEWTRSRRG